MKTTAIIVLYNDNTADAVANVSRIAAQVDEVCLVDNSETSCAERFASIANAVYLPQFSNTGIAAAQNIGLRHAIDSGADFILFADPDSVVPDGAVAQLHEVFGRLRAKGLPVGGVGSTAYNRDTGSPYPLQSNFVRHLQDEQVTEVGFLMNSISLIPTRYIEQNGLMDEPLFIDGIDSEWCWRATDRLGLRFFIDDRLHIKHQLGLGTRVIAGRERAITPPHRFYYQFRNYLWLSRRSYVPRKWLLENGRKYLVKAIYYPLMVAPRWAYLRNISRGVMAGFRKQPHPDAFTHYGEATSGTSECAK